VPGRTENEAVEQYIAPMQRALGCFTNCKFVASARRLNESGFVTVNRGAPVALPGHPLTLEFGQRYRVILDPDPSPGLPFKVTIEGYYINLNDSDGELFAFHWHPGNDRIRYPHVHVRDVDLHVPTGRVLLEDALRLAAEIGSTPRNSAWIDVLETNRENVSKSATWGV